jgi:hypothetical protein
MKVFINECHIIDLVEIFLKLINGIYFIYLFTFSKSPCKGFNEEHKTVKLRDLAYITTQTHFTHIADIFNSI